MTGTSLQQYCITRRMQYSDINNREVSSPIYCHFHRSSAMPPVYQNICSTPHSCDSKTPLRLFYFPVACALPPALPAEHFPSRLSTHVTLNCTIPHSTKQCATILCVCSWNTSTVTTPQWSFTLSQG